MSAIKIVVNAITETLLGEFLVVPKQKYFLAETTPRDRGVIFNTIRTHIRQKILREMGNGTVICTFLHQYFETQVCSAVPHERILKHIPCLEGAD